MKSRFQFRQPEHTGENRCMPCTAANVLIAIVVSGLAFLRSRVVGTSTFGLCLGIIYLRGYLVPRTPSLTKQYFPDRVLRAFEKEPLNEKAPRSSDVDIEKHLLDSGVMTPCENGSDLCLESTFRDKWYARMETQPERGDYGDLLIDTIDNSFGRVTFERTNGTLVARKNGSIVGQWLSPAAAIADVTAAREFSGRASDLNSMTTTETIQLLRGLQVFVEQCPECGGSVQIEQEVVESCCRKQDVVLSKCQNCNSSLFEVEWKDQHSAPESNPGVA